MATRLRRAGCRRGSSRGKTYLQWFFQRLARMGWTRPYYQDNWLGSLNKGGNLHCHVGTERLDRLICELSHHNWAVLCPRQPLTLMHGRRRHWPNRKLQWATGRIRQRWRADYCESNRFQVCHWRVLWLRADSSPDHRIASWQTRPWARRWRRLWRCPRCRDARVGGCKIGITPWWIREANRIRRKEDSHISSQRDYCRRSRYNDSLRT